MTQSPYFNDNVNNHGDCVMLLGTVVIERIMMYQHVGKACLKLHHNTHHFTLTLKYLY